MASFIDNTIFTAGVGSGAFVVAGAVPGYQSPVGRVTDGKVYRYRAQTANLFEWEIGTAVASLGGTTFARSPIASSTGGLVNFTTAPNVFLTFGSEDFLKFDDAMSLSPAQKAQARANIGAPDAAAVQPLDATLTGLSGLDAIPGVLAQTGADTFAKRTLLSTANQFVITNPDGAAGDPSFAVHPEAAFPALLEPTGSLSLSSTSPYSTTDIVGATNFYYHARGPSRVPVWSIALNAWRSLPFVNAFTVPIDANPARIAHLPANSVADVWAFYHPQNGLMVGLGTAWSSYTTGRGATCSDIVRKDGIWVNTLTQYIRTSAAGDVLGTHYFLIAASEATYLGTIGSVLIGQTEDSAARRLVWNAYNTRRRHALKKLPGGYAYNGALRQVNASAVNQVETLCGIDGVYADAWCQYWAQCSTIPTVINVAIWDTANVLLPQAECIGGAGRNFDASGGFPGSIQWRGNHGIGRRVFKAVEGSNAATTTWLADSFNFSNGLRVTLDEA